ncbi:MAG TPA: ABC transporter substrate-binding protein [Chloroflexota bacterium]|nr:ABC transporter substrate-binding protein [Chloroflexota bacterium]
MKWYGRMPHVLILLPLILYVLVLTACWRSEPKVIHIGVVNLSPRLAPVLDGFKKAMAEYGYVEGENVTYLYDGPAENITALDDRVQALLDADVDLIVAISTPAAQAAYRLAQAAGTPVVFGPVTDPVMAGLAASVSHPGGIATGVRLGAESEAKRLEWLLQVNEQIQRVYVPYNPDDASALSSVTAVSEAAAKLGVTIILREAGNDDEITAAITDIPDDAHAILLPQDSLVAARIDDFAAAAIARQLPLSTPTDEQVERGALISYSFRLHELGVQMARLADQIVQGTPPADLPVETARFFLTVNLRTAAAIHLEIPEIVLQSADKIIR